MPSLHSTCEEHMPSAHCDQRSFEKKDGVSYSNWARKIGKYTKMVITHILKSQR